MHTPPPCCPRCEYELTGETDRWHEQCPLEGVCPECGLALQWRDVYQICNEWGSEVGWYAEHAHTLPSMLARTPGTILRLVFPSRFFNPVNHRRQIRPVALSLWLLVVSLLIHLFVSPIGYAAHRVEGYAYDRRGIDGLARMLHTQLTEIPSAVSYPFFFVYYGSNGFDIVSGPFSGYEWYDYMLPVWAIIGVPIFWVLLIGFVLLVRHDEEKDHRHDARLLTRLTLLSMLPAMIHIQIVRLGFGFHAATGMTSMTDWVPIAFIISILAMIFWQQLLWTHAVRRYWHIRRSFLINIGGCFGSFLFGIFFMAWVLR